MRSRNVIIFCAKCAANVKDVEDLGSEQDAFAVPWKLDKSATVDVRVEKLDNVVPEGEVCSFALPFFPVRLHNFSLRQSGHHFFEGSSIFFPFFAFSVKLYGSCVRAWSRQLFDRRLTVAKPWC